MTTKINQIFIYERDRKAEAVLDNGYTVEMDYINAEKEFAKMFNNPEEYDLCDIIKFDRRG